MTIKHNQSLLPYNTFGIDVKADTVITYCREEELVGLLSASSANLAKPLLHVGEGSNLLFLKDFAGTVLVSEIKDIDVVDRSSQHVTVRVGAGWKMDDFIRHSIMQGWYGLENLSHIPGQVGASAVQNIGAYGVEAGDFIYCVNCISLEDGTSRTFLHDECRFSYRHSIFKTPEFRGKYAVISVDYRLNLTFVPNLEYGGIRQALVSEGFDVDNLSAMDLRNAIISIRKSKLPDLKEQGNAGSFFMNPIVGRTTFERLESMYHDMPRYVVDDNHIKIPAAWLIEQCGWKGSSLGPAGVHPRQPLVLVNLGGATGNDIKVLSERIRQDVYERFGVEIFPEVNFI